MGTGDGVRLTHAVFVTQARSDGSHTLPLAPFGMVPFDRCQVGGQPLPDQDARRLVMRTAQGDIRALPSALAPTGGFAVTWKHR